MYSPTEPRSCPVIGGLTTIQARAAAKDGAVLVLAGAGPDKTKTLTAAIVHRIGAGGVAAGRVLAVTFTNKATTKMSSRMPAALDGGPAPSWIGTFHGLAARQLRIEPEIAGLRTRLRHSRCRRQPPDRQAHAQGAEPGQQRRRHGEWPRSAR